MMGMTQTERLNDMIKTWLLIGGLKDGEVVKVDDRDIHKEMVTLVEMDEGADTLTGGVVVKYRVFIRGGITNKATGGVMAHESFKQAGVMNALVDFYAGWHKRVAGLVRAHLAAEEAKRAAADVQPVAVVGMPADGTDG